MRGCLTTIITLIILFAFGGTALAAIVIIVPLLLGEQDAKSVHMDCNYHSTDYITKDSCQSKSHYCKLHL